MGPVQGLGQRFIDHDDDVDGKESRAAGWRLTLFLRYEIEKGLRAVYMGGGTSTVRTLSFGFLSSTFFRPGVNKLGEPDYALAL